MKLEIIIFLYLRNETHFQFCEDFRELMAQFNPLELKIAPQFNQWQVLFVEEDEAFKQILKSIHTENLHEADRKRDATFRGMVEANRAVAKNHFNPAVKEAAKRLKIVFDTYGNIARKPLYQETAAITNLLQDFSDAYSDDVQLVGLTAWKQELAADNNEFDRINRERYDESAARTASKMKEVRAQIDAVYQTIAERINAVAVLEPDETVESFITKLNVIIKKYNLILAQQQGRRKAAKGKVAESPEGGEA